MGRYHRDPNADRRQKQQEALVYDDRMNTIVEEYRKIGYTYTPSLVEREALIFEKYKQKFADTYTYSIQHIIRIKHRSKEYMVYRLNEEVVDSNNRVHQGDRQIGWHTLPVTETTTKRHDEFGEAVDTDIRIVGQRLVYEIPFDREKVKELIQNSKSPAGSMGVARGSNSPPDIVSGNLLTVWNEQEFIESEFDDLYGASENGFIRQGYGGVEAYKKSIQQQQQQQQNVSQ
jgi:hypothetical protein